MYYSCSENKGADQLRSYRSADVRLCFHICKELISAQMNLIQYTRDFLGLNLHIPNQYGFFENCVGFLLVMFKFSSIFSVFLGNIKDAFDKDPNLSNLLLDEFFKKEIQKCQAGWRRVVSTAVMHGVPTPAFSTALAFFDGYRSARLPANLLQVSIVKLIFCFYVTKLGLLTDFDNHQPS